MIPTRTFKKLICLLSALCCLAGLFACGGPQEPGGTETSDAAEPPYISVALADTAGLTVLSDNPVRIRSGEDAEFRVEVEVGYRFVPQDGVTLTDDGRLTVPDVLYPSTIVVECAPASYYTVDVKPDRPDLGTCTVSGGSGTRIRPGSDATVTAKPADGAAFLGYSADRPLSLGGTLITGDAVYTFPCTEDCEMIANFTAIDPAPLADPAAQQRILYHANGGVIFGHADSFCCDYDDDYYYFPNTLPDLGYFTREGYVLVGYNTAPDGDGTFVGCGWNALTDGGAAELYAVWLPVTPDECFAFAPDEDGTGWVVTACTSTDRTVVIPETHGGAPVTGIAAEAFSRCPCETLMVTRHIRTVADGAIADCPQLSRIIFSDGVVNISDACIRDCPSFATLSMHAVMMPRYCDDREGTYAIKYEHLRASAGMPKLMIAAGSNCAYGLDSTVLYDALKDDYDVINYGCNAYSPMLFYLEACLPYFNEGDILLLCPEDNDFQFGRGETRPYIWHFFEAAYEAFEYVDQRHFVNTFTSFAEFNQTRMNMRPKTYQDKTRETTNRFGDYCAVKEGQLSSFDPFTVPNKTYFHATNVARYADKLNEALDRYHDAGVRVWMSYSVVNENWLEPDSQPGGEDYLRYIDIVETRVHATVISDMSDYIMPPEYFYNSHQHLNTPGTAIRSERLLRDVQRQLAKGD